MFDDTGTASRGAREVGGRFLALPAALLAHALALGVFTVGQLWAVAQLPEPDGAVTFFSLPPPPPLSRGGRTEPQRPATRRGVRAPEVQPAVVPASTPARVERAQGSGDDREVTGGGTNGTPGGVDGGAPPPEGESPPPSETEPVFPVRSVSTAPVALHRPLPEYPELARRARVEGTVLLEAVIDRLGNVTDVRIVRDLRLGCGEAAREAVRSWKYEPAILNGRTVSVILTVTVRFELRGGP